MDTALEVLTEGVPVFYSILEKGQLSVLMEFRGAIPWYSRKFLGILDKSLHTMSILDEHLKGGIDQET